MKKFIKTCLILVLVFVIVGIILLIVAAAGGVTRASLKLFSDQGRLRYGPVNIRIGDGFSVNFDGHDYGCTEDSAISSANDHCQAADQISEFYIDNSAEEYVIEASEDDFIYID